MNKTTGAWRFDIAVNLANIGASKEEFLAFLERKEYGKHAQVRDMFARTIPVSKEIRALYIDFKKERVL